MYAGFYHALSLPVPLLSLDASVAAEPMHWHRNPA